MRIAIMCAALLAATTATAQSEPLYVIGGNIGASVMSDWTVENGFAKDGTGVNLGGFFGVRPAVWFQWDLFESQWSKSRDPYGIGVDYSYVSVGTGVRLGYFGDAIPVRPYASVGGGGVGTSLHILGEKVTGWGASFNLGAGLNVPLGKTGTEVGLRYRWRRAYAKTFSGGGMTIASADAFQQAHEIALEVLWAGR